MQEPTQPELAANEVQPTALDDDEPGKPIEDDGFVQNFHEKAEAGGLKASDEGKARSTIGTATYETASGKTLRYTKEGHNLLVGIWPTGNEKLQTSTQFIWDGEVWEQPEIKLTFSTDELVSHLISSVSS